MPQPPVEAAAALPRWNAILGLSRHATRVMAVVLPLAEAAQFPWHKFQRGTKRREREQDDEKEQHLARDKIACTDE